MTAETASNEPNQGERSAGSGSRSGFAGVHLATAAALLVVGTLAATLAAVQLVVPELLSGVAIASYGKLAPAARLLIEGWVIIAVLALARTVLSRVTGRDTERSGLSVVATAVIALGVVAGAIGILIGLGSGLSGQEAPLWARAVMALGFLLATVAIVGTARSAGRRDTNDEADPQEADQPAGRDRLGPVGWYLTAAPIWLTLSALVGLVPFLDGVAGSIQNAFVNATFTGLFYVTAAVGLLYYVFTTLAGRDPTAPRPLSALGFWSLTLTWANLGGIALIYSPAPDWYETIAIAFGIATLVPLITITGDLGLILRGSVADIEDRGSLRAGVIAGLSLAAATVVYLTLAWRATSAVAQFSLLIDAAWALVVLGGASFAVFATVSVLRGGRRGGPSLHTIASGVGLTLVAGAFVVGGVLVGFSWAAGPADQAYVNAGLAWKVTVDTAEPVLWVAAVGMLVYALAQIVFLATLGRTSDEPVADSAMESDYDLEFAGAPRYATWGRLMGGVAAVWLVAATITLVLPAIDDTDREPTILADTYRTYPEGSAELAGRNLFIAEGCVTCHTQEVRPVGTDVGLGPVSVAGDYAHEVPALLGARRYGPDLMHVASRSEFFDVVLVGAHLEDPRSLVPWSNMPSYDYLSDDDIADLVAYIETLR